jgi:hypothetical protein
MKAKNTRENNRFADLNFTGIVEWCDGIESVRWISFEYFKNGKHHRENGPAIEWVAGNKCWYINGKHHRENGPAIEWADGSKEWFLNGRIYLEHEWKIELEKLKKYAIIST